MPVSLGWPRGTNRETYTEGHGVAGDVLVHTRTCLVTGPYRVTTALLLCHSNYISDGSRDIVAVNKDLKTGLSPYNILYKTLWIQGS